MALIRYFFRRYRARSVLLAIALGVAGMAEGFGVLSLLPLLELAGGGTPGRGPAQRLVLGVLDGVGVAPGVGAVLAVAVAALWCKALLRWLAMRQAGDTVARVARDFRVRLVRGLLSARQEHVERERSGELATALSRDAFWASYAYRHGVGAAAAAIQFAVYAGAIVLVSWHLGVAAVAAAAGLGLALGVFVRMGRRSGADQTRLSRALASRLLDVVGGLRAIKAMGRERWYLPVLERQVEDLERAERRQVLAVESLQALHEPLLALALAPAVWLAVTRAEVPIATLVVAVFLFHRLMTYGQRVQTEYQGLAAAEAAFVALDRQIDAAERRRERTRGSDRLARFERALSARDVTVAFDGRRVLEGITLEVPAFGVTALAGPSGIGKTTLLEVLLGLREPDGGGVYVDDVPLVELDVASWRGQVGYVPQGPILLDGTIAANVTLGEPVPDEAVERALRRAGAAGLVDVLPGGIHAEVGERGVRLSGGERQRVAIARALLHSPALLVLDEPTSDLDPDAEASILDTLRGLRSDVAVIIASHRPAVLEVADRVHDLRTARFRPSVSP